MLITCVRLTIAAGRLIKEQLLLNTRLVICRILLVGLLTQPALWAESKSPVVVRARPGLAVVIAVDQLRADLLDHYDPIFSGGFRRLRDQGFQFQRASVDHAITVSHPGHVTLASGLAPAHHGIVDAAFYELRNGAWVFSDALQDPEERILGVPDAKGVSARKILASTLSEWALKADPNARSVAIGSGQFSSLLHAGRTGTDVYWYMPSAGRFVTSTFYRREYPQWLTRFNTAALPRFISDMLVWDTTVPPNTRSLAAPDARPYENDKVHTTFPHALRDVTSPERAASAATQARWLALTPGLDAATLELAQEAVRALSLGKRGSTDVLSIVPSQVDEIGHSFGPESQEQLDNLLRLDRELKTFFDFLDGWLGRDAYVVALSADHGAANVPEYEQDNDRPGRRLRQAEIDAVLRKVADAMAHYSGTRQQSADLVAKTVGAFDFVADTMTPADLLDKPPTDAYRALYRNSYRADRVPRFPLFSFDNGESEVAKAGVAVRLTQGTVLDLDPSGHGSPYPYDTSVPLIFMGAGVSPGVSQELAHTTDLAPTLAALAGIPIPEHLDGRPLLKANPVRH